MRAACWPRPSSSFRKNTASTRISRLATVAASTRIWRRPDLNNLATRYLGLELAHPIIASASPLTATFDGMRRLEDARAAAVVMASLYEEQVRADDTRYATFTEDTAGFNPEAATYFPELPDYR